jgi:hypothetical protein
MHHRTDWYAKQSFAHLFPHGVLCSAAVSHNALEWRRTQFGEFGIARRFDTRQALQQPMQKFHIVCRARFQSRCEPHIVDREALADFGQRVII